jgi:diguanylate cyclase (GGDEF)-like protein/PAS domain S-box-containing protein
MTGWTLRAHGRLRTAAVLLLAAGLVLVAARTDGLPAELARLTVATGAAVVAWTGDRTRPERRRGRHPWHAIALTCWAVADVLRQLLEWTSGSTPTVSVTDLGWLAACAVLGGSALTGRFGGRARPGARLHAVLDGCAALTVALLVVAQTSIWSTLGAEGTGPLVATVLVAHPVLDTVLLGLCAWRLVLNGRVRPVPALMIAALLCWLATDLGRLASTATAVPGWADAGWLVGVCLLAVVPWVPQSGGDAADGRHGPGRGLWRTAVTLAPFTAPALVEVIAWKGGEDVNPVPGLVVWAVLLVLTTVRTRLIALDAERAWAAVRSLARRYEALAVNSTDAVAVVDPDGVLTADSRSLAELLGQPGEAGRSLPTLLSALGVDPADVQAVLDRAAAVPGEHVELELRGGRPAGGAVWLGGRAVDLRADPDVAGIAISVYDITARKLAEAELAHRAFHDGLTGLANRALFLDRTEQALRRAGRTGSPPIVLFLDLDGFKDVNDSLGHQAGDELLRTVAQRLLGTVRSADTVARLGGDEFAVLLDDTRGGMPFASALAQRLLEVIGEPVELGGHRVRVAASTGIVAAEPGATPLSLFRDADIAMYRAKAAGRAQWVVFDPGMRAAALQRIELERELAGALSAGQLRLAYQPVVDLQTEAVVGFEALLRWRHPTLGSIGPDRFVPLAEEAGHIVPIGRWVLAEATRTAARWQQAHPSATPLSMAVNVSARQLADGTLLADVAEALAGSRVPPSSLVLEVTETALVTDPDAVAEQLVALRGLGVRLALDDFGTGYSSLSYLRQFPVDVLKIDRSFVDLLDGPAEDAAIVHGLVQLARTLDLEIVAEGVETVAQRDRLRAEHCQLAQGWLFAPALEVDEAERLLLTRALPTRDPLAQD